MTSQHDGPGPTHPATTLEVAVPVTTVWSSPDAPRDVDAAVVGDAPDARAWADSLDTELRLGLHGRTETQLLVGEPVRVVEERDGWSRVLAPWQASSKEPEGYPGWVRSSHLTRPAADGPPPGGATATVVAASTPCWVDGAVQVDLSLGTVLPLDSVGEGTAVLHLPGGRRGEVRLDDLRLDPTAPGGGGAASPTTDDVLARARAFLGVRYLWGGTSIWGIDCSGLVHLTLRSLGVLVPRDAHDQVEAPGVEPVPLEAVQPGDLYFFARPGGGVYHVGFATEPVDEQGRPWMLHAPEAGELVEDAPLSPARAEHLVAAGRVRGVEAGPLRSGS
jgi:gamma-D-glutamyl-L-lysine dipeptidyl-peptidase